MDIPFNSQLILLAHLFPLCQNFKVDRIQERKAFELEMSSRAASGCFGDRKRFSDYLDAHPTNAGLKLQRLNSEETGTKILASQDGNIPFELMMAMMRNVFAHEENFEFCK